MRQRLFLYIAIEQINYYIMELLNDIFEFVKLAWVPGVILWAYLMWNTMRIDRRTKKRLDSVTELNDNTQKMLTENLKLRAEMTPHRENPMTNPKPIIVDIPEGVNPMEWIMDNHERIMKETGMEINKCQCKKCQVKRELGETESFMLEALGHLNELVDCDIDNIFGWCEANEDRIERFRAVFLKFDQERVVEMIDGYLSYKQK